MMIPIFEREVAQPGRALGLGPRSRRFESCLPDNVFLNLLLGQFLLQILREVAGSPEGTPSEESCLPDNVF